MQMVDVSQKLKHISNDYDIVVSGIETWPSTVLISEANNRDSQTVTIIPSILADDRQEIENSYFKIKQSMKSIISTVPSMGFLKQVGLTGNCSASTVCVSGDIMKRWVADRGTDLKKIKTTGIPRFDYLFKNNNNINKNTKRLLYLHDAFYVHGRRDLGDTQREQIKQLRYLSTHDDENIVSIRPHPKSLESEKNFLKKIKRESDIQLSSYSKVEDLKKSDIVATMYSTMAYEAAHMNCVVLIPTFGKGLKNKQVKLARHFTEAEDIEILEKMVHDIRHKDKLRMSILDYQKYIAEQMITENSVSSATTIVDEVFVR